MKINLLRVLITHFRKSVFNFLKNLSNKSVCDLAAIYAHLGCKFSYINATWDPEKKLLIPNIHKYTIKWYFYYTYLTTSCIWWLYTVGRFLIQYGNSNPSMEILLIFLMLFYTFTLGGVLGIELYSFEIQNIFNEILSRCRSKCDKFEVQYLFVYVLLI